MKLPQLLDTDTILKTLVLNNGSVIIQMKKYIVIMVAKEMHIMQETGRVSM